MSVLSTFGIGPAALVLIGLFWASKWSKALLVVGGLWGLANLFYAKREISATVDVTGDPVISYPGATGNGNL